MVDSKTNIAMKRCVCLLISATSFPVMLWRYRKKHVKCIICLFSVLAEFFIRVRLCLCVEVGVCFERISFMCQKMDVTTEKNALYYCMGFLLMHEKRRFEDKKRKIQAKYPSRL